jgi:hypothetical protein
LAGIGLTGRELGGCRDGEGSSLENSIYPYFFEEGRVVI